MEALELYKEEDQKMEEHKYASMTAVNKVEPRDASSSFLLLLTRHLPPLPLPSSSSPSSFLFLPPFSSLLIPSLPSSSSLLPLPPLPLPSSSSRWIVYERSCCLLQLPPPRPNPILAALGNISVSEEDDPLNLHHHGDEDVVLMVSVFLLQPARYVLDVIKKVRSRWGVAPPPWSSLVALPVY